MMISPYILLIIGLLTTSCASYNLSLEWAKRLVDEEGQLPAKQWWERANFYQLYPRSFKDSDGDGVRFICCFKEETNLIVFFYRLAT